MAFIREKKTHNISFGPDHQYHGLEFQTEAADIAYFANLAKELTRLGQISNNTEGHVPANDEGMAILDEMVAAFHRVTDMFATKLISWNYQEKVGDEIRDIPPTAEGLRSIGDNEFVVDLIGEWMQAIGGVDKVLKDALIDGETSLMPSIPMEMLSPSQAS